MEYFTFPMKTMRVTLNYVSGAHATHVSGSPKDFPIDCGGEDDSSLSPIYATVDLKVVAKRGVGSSVTNVVWLQTVNPVKTPKFEDYAFMTIAHWNDSDSAMSKYNVGDIIRKGSIICYEGTDGVSSAHVQISCGRGYSDNWVKNSDGAWVMTGDTRYPEDVMYIDRNFTVENWGGSLSWVTLPTFYGTAVERNTYVRQVNVADNLRDAYSSSGGSIKGKVNQGVYNLLAESGEYIKIEENLWVKLETGKVSILEIESAPSIINPIADTYIGDSVTISLQNYIQNVTHTLRYEFGRYNGTIAENVESEVNFVVPKDFYYDMTTKTGIVKIYCDTFSGDKKEGTRSTTFKIMAKDSDVEPVVSMSTTVDEKTKSLTNDDQTVIRNFTDLTYKINAELKYGANLVSYQLDDGNMERTVESTGILYKTDLKDGLKYRVIDSRGYNEWHNYEINVIDYKVPTLELSIKRNNNNLEEVRIKYSGTFYNGVFGNKDGALTNNLMVKLYYRREADIKWTEYTDFNPQINGNNYEEEKLLPIVFDKGTIYYFKLEVSDLLDSSIEEKNIQDEQGYNFDFVYPVGRGFIDFTDTDYSDYLGFSWEKTLLGVFPVGLDPNQDEFNELGKKGGSKYLQAHSHSYSGSTNSTGSHTHFTKGVEAYSQGAPSKTALRPGGWDGDQDATAGIAAGAHTHTFTGTTTSYGKGNGENLPPYQVVNFWKRIA